LRTTSDHLPSLLGALLFFLGALLLLGTALLMGITALAGLLTESVLVPGQTIFPVVVGFEGLLLLAAAFFALQKYLGRPAAEQEISLSVPTWQLLLFGLVAAVSLGVGYLVTNSEPLNWLLLPLLTILAVVLPLGVLLGLGTRKLATAPRWQAWTVLGLAMTLGPVLLFALEIVLAILFFAGGVVYLMTQPALVFELRNITEQIMLIGPQSEEAVRLLAPYITQPGVIGAALLYIAVLVPAVEEIFKPIGVWLFGRKLDSPAQGFALGALCGAGYALIETMGVSGQQASGWAPLLSSRIGTGLLHITTSALMGAAIVMAFRQRRYLRLLGTYLIAILLHGLWNALAMGFTFATLAEMLDEPGRIGSLRDPMIAAMAALAVALFAILVLSNRRLRKSMIPLPAPDLPQENMDRSGPT
jgi:hypothetical protein